jgi:hypothetical protein
LGTTYAGHFMLRGLKKLAWNCQFQQLDYLPSIAKEWRSDRDNDLNNDYIH